MDHNEDTELKSKTQAKKEMKALQEVGIALTRLPPEKLAKIPMSDILREALETASSVKTHSAIRRHEQYIGKLMRKDGSEDILKAYQRLLVEEQNSARRFHQLEHLRDRLVSGDQDTLVEFLQEYPHVNRQILIQLIKKTQKEKDSNNQKANSAKKLFQFLRESSQSL